MALLSGLQSHDSVPDAGRLSFKGQGVLATPTLLADKLRVSVSPGLLLAQLSDRAPQVRIKPNNVIHIGISPTPGHGGLESVRIVADCAYVVHYLSTVMAGLDPAIYGVATASA